MIGRSEGEQIEHPQPLPYTHLKTSIRTRKAGKRAPEPNDRETRPIRAFTPWDRSLNRVHIAGWDEAWRCDYTLSLEV